MVLKGHEESYNPPPEYLPNEDEVMLRFSIYEIVANFTY